MRLPDVLLDEMNSFFSDYSRDKTSYENYFSEKRKLIKLWVDSAVEQTVEEISKKKPRNPQHARLLVNGLINEDACHGLDVELCTALNELLAEYRIIETKDYVEFESGIRKFIVGPLARFCEAIAKSSGNAPSALRLASTLRKV